VGGEEQKIVTFRDDLGHVAETGHKAAREKQTKNTRVVETTDTEILSFIKFPKSSLFHCPSCGDPKLVPAKSGAFWHHSPFEGNTV